MVERRAATVITVTDAPANPALRPRREDVLADGTLTACWVVGSDDAVRRMVALHGLRGTHHGLLPIISRLAGVGDGTLQVLVPDLPGFGQSPPLAGRAHDVDGYAAWARHLLAQHGPGAVLLGHSFGSVVAAAVAASPFATASLAGLVLVNPIAAPPLAGRRRFATGVTTAYHRLAGALPERAGTALLRSRVATRVASVAMVTTDDAELRAWIHAEHGRHFNRFADRRVLLESYGAAVSHDVTEHSADVGVPTLLVAGVLDDVAPLTSQRALVGRFTDATLVEVAGTGHLAHYEAPAAVAAAVDAFLARLPA